MFPLTNVRKAELPVLVRIINALEESLSSTMERCRSFQIFFSSANSSGSLGRGGYPDARERPAPPHQYERLKMPIRPRSGKRQAVRERIVPQLPAPGCLKLKTSQPCGLTPDMTCRIAPSLLAASILKNQPQRIAVRRIVKLLPRT